MPTVAAVMPGFSSGRPVVDAGSRPVSTRTTPDSSADAARGRIEIACGAAARCRAPTRRSAGAFCATPAPAPSMRSSGAKATGPHKERGTLLPKKATPSDRRPAGNAPHARSAADTGAWLRQTSAAGRSAATAFPAGKKRIRARTADAESPGAVGPGAGAARLRTAARE